MPATELPVIGLNLRIEGPVDVEELVSALGSFHRQYARYMRAAYRTHTGAVPEQEETRLFIREIKTSSILADLVPWVPHAAIITQAAFPLIEYHNAFADFLNYMRGYMSFLLGKGEPPAEANAALVPADFAEILRPFASRRTGELELELKTETAGGYKQEMTLRYSHADAITAHAKATRLASMKNQESADYHNVVLYLPRLDRNAHPQNAKQTPDRGVIERISSKALRVVWASEHDSIRVKNAPGNPLLNSYLVDVNVEMNNGKPILYSIVRLHEIIEPEADNAEPDLLNNQDHLP